VIATIEGVQRGDIAVAKHGCGWLGINGDWPRTTVSLRLHHNTVTPQHRRPFRQLLLSCEPAYVFDPTPQFTAARITLKATRIVTVVTITVAAVPLDGYPLAASTGS
jgi:hypothetical protein